MFDEEKINNFINSTVRPQLCKEQKKYQNPGYKRFFKISGISNKKNIVRYFDRINKCQVDKADDYINVSGYDKRKQAFTYREQPPKFEDDPYPNFFICFCDNILCMTRVGLFENYLFPIKSEFSDDCLTEAEIEENITPLNFVLLYDFTDNDLLFVKPTLSALVPIRYSSKDFDNIKVRTALLAINRLYKANIIISEESKCKLEKRFLNADILDFIKNKLYKVISVFEENKAEEKREIYAEAENTINKISKIGYEMIKDKINISQRNYIKKDVDYIEDGLCKEALYMICKCEKKYYTKETDNQSDIVYMTCPCCGRKNVFINSQYEHITNYSIFFELLTNKNILLLIHRNTPQGIELLRAYIITKNNFEYVFNESYLIEGFNYIVNSPEEIKEIFDNSNISHLNVPDIFGLNEKYPHRKMYDTWGHSSCDKGYSHKKNFIHTIFLFVKYPFIKEWLDENGNDLFHSIVKEIEDKECDNPKSMRDIFGDNK